MKTVAHLTCVALLSVVGLNLPTHGSVLFAAAANGDDLDVTLTAPLNFTVNAGFNAFSYGVVFHDVYSASQPDVVQTWNQASLTMTLPGGVSQFGGAAGTSNGLGVVDGNDLFLTYGFGASLPVAIGDTVTLAAGTGTISNFLSRGGNVPDSPASSAQFAEGNTLSALSLPTPIPEPSAVMYLIVASLLFRVRRHS